jgi:hypothetical protein
MARYENAKEAAKRLHELADRMAEHTHKIRWNIRISIQRPKGEPGLTSVTFSNLK